MVWGSKKTTTLPRESKNTLGNYLVTRVIEGTWVEESNSLTLL